MSIGGLFIELGHEQRLFNLAWLRDAPAAVLTGMKG